MGERRMLDFSLSNAFLSLLDTDHFVENEELFLCLLACFSVSLEKSKKETLDPSSPE